MGIGFIVNFFIEEFGKIKYKIEGVVLSLEVFIECLKVLGIEVFELNEVSNLLVYIDGVDEVIEYKYMIKGGGVVFICEKIVVGVVIMFVCIVDESKCVFVLGLFFFFVEVIFMVCFFVV